MIGARHPSPPSSDHPEYRTADFDYAYPPELIAQHGLSDRSASRLLVLDRATGAKHHHRFTDLPSMATAGDLLVRNVTRVVPARVRGRRENGRDAEILFVHGEPDGTWLVMAHPGGKLKPGRVVRFHGETGVEILEVLGGGLRRVRVFGTSVGELMRTWGAVPLPPYIDRAAEPDDVERYQTVFSSVPGSVAAPTAGLHFTPAVLEQLVASGVGIADVVLHVGPGTFKPVSVDDPARHRMHAEWYRLPEDTVTAITATRAGGGRVWAVGTTVARVLESAAAGGTITAGEGWTDLFIRPPYAFRAIDALITNFHLPRSTLLMLVCAFGGYDAVMAAYGEAVERRYRLYSYGDAMVIV